MKRVIIKFKNGDHINIRADCIDLRDSFVMAWDENDLVVIANADEVISCHVAEQRE